MFSFFSVPPQAGHDVGLIFFSLEGADDRCQRRAAALCIPGSRQGCIMTSLPAVTKKPRSGSPRSAALDEFALFLVCEDDVIELI
jgi:hypothetical protein